jgi:hypothetical protein
MWKGWKTALVIVQPDTVVSWQRQSFRWFWQWKSRWKRSGRPPLDLENETTDPDDESGQSTLGCASHPW